jgi:hypothetical protein
MNTQSGVRRSLVIASLVLLTATACGSGAAQVTPSVSPTPSPSPSAPAGGGGSGDPGSGVVGGPVDPSPGDPGAVAPVIVIARPGQLDPHPVAATSLEPNVDGRHVTVKLTWYSGVEPCNVLDSVRVDRAGGEIILTIIEGSSDQDAICIEIAQLKTTIVDLGELEPGQYRVSSPGGEAKPVVVTVS